MKWYIINVINTKENQAIEYIEKHLESSKVKNSVSQVISPKEKYFQIRQGKKIKAERNYFPGYIFIECDINGEIIRLIENIQGVKSFLKGAGKPIPMTKREVENLLSKVEDDLEITDNVEIDKLYKIGQQVKVIDGPFSSLIGNITNVNASKKSLSVEINIFSRKTPIELTIDQVISE